MESGRRCDECWHPLLPKRSTLGTFLHWLSKHAGSPTSRLLHAQMRAAIVRGLQRLVCDICGAEKSQRAILGCHLANKHYFPFLPYVPSKAKGTCDDCGAKGKYLSNHLFRHWLAFHVDSSASRQLRAEMKAIRVKPKTCMSCDSCGVKVSRRRDLLGHLAKNHAFDIVDCHATCDCCGRRYAGMDPKWELALHIRVRSKHSLCSGLVKLL